MQWVDEHCLEVEVNKGQSLNQVFALLAEQNIDIISMRNKSNRLEELFVGMVEKNMTDKTTSDTGVASV